MGTTLARRLSAAQPATTRTIMVHVQDGEERECAQAPLWTVTTCTGFRPQVSGPPSACPQSAFDPMIASSSMTSSRVSGLRMSPAAQQNTRFSVVTRT
jgi:hypothetical protein